jgi:hypothetical protein
MKFGELDTVAIKGEAGIGVGEWRKWCGGCWVLWPLCVFGCISVVVVLVSGIAEG